jgi:tRNA U34 5-carboxymethylaminomethyl modifying enzyme MnmG/GidA
VSQDGQRRDGFQLLGVSEYRDRRSWPCPGLGHVSEDALEQFEIEALYATYVERQERDANRFADEAQAIPGHAGLRRSDRPVGGAARKAERIRPERWHRPAASTA